MMFLRKKHRTAVAVLVIVGVFFLYVRLITSPGIEDIQFYQKLADGLHREGQAYLRKCLSPALCDGQSVMYPPLFAGIYWGATLLFDSIGNIGSFLKIKYMLFLFAAFTIGAAVLYGNTVGPPARKNGKRFLTVLFLVATCASLLLNSVVLGHMDVLTLPFFVLSMYWYQKKRIFWSGFFFALTFLVKWQPLMYLPLIGIYLLVREGWGAAVRFGLGIAAGALSVWAGLSFFPLERVVMSLTTGSLHQPMSATPNFPWITAMILYREPFAKLFQVPMSSFPYLDTTLVDSAGLWTVYWLWKALNAIVYVYILWFVIRPGAPFSRRGEGLLVGITLITWSYYLFSTGVHENHLITGVISALLLALTVPALEYRRLYRYTDAVSAVSMILVDGFTGEPFLPDRGITVLTTAAVVIGIVSVVLFRRFLRAVSRG